MFQYVANWFANFFFEYFPGDNGNGGIFFYEDAGGYSLGGSAITSGPVAETSSGGSFWYPFSNFLKNLKPKPKHYKFISRGGYGLSAIAKTSLRVAYKVMDFGVTKLRAVAPVLFTVKYRVDAIGKHSIGGRVDALIIAREIKPAVTRKTSARRVIKPKPEPATPRKQARREPIMLRRMLPEQTATLPDIAIERKAAVVGIEHFETQTPTILPVNRIQRGRDSEHDLIALLIALDEI